VHICRLKTKPSRIVPREPIPMYENNKLVKRLINCFNNGHFGRRIHNNPKEYT
jgi:hypothetical protein